MMAMARPVCLLVCAAAACTPQNRKRDDVPSQPASESQLLALEREAYFGKQTQINLDYATHSQLRAGNSAKLLMSAESAERRIANARDADVILVKTFIFKDDDTGRRLAQVLAERARAGAYVVVQYDVKGSLGSAEERAQMARNATPENPLGEKDLLHGLRQAGVMVIPTNSPARPLELDELANNLARATRSPLEASERSVQSLKSVAFVDHEKYWITGRRLADGYVELRAILGGTNLASEYAFGGTKRVDSRTGEAGWRDTDVELRGPILNDIVVRYFDTMDYHYGRLVDVSKRKQWNPPQRRAGDANVRFLWSHPQVEQLHAIYHMYRVLIDATPAGSQIQFENAYFIPYGDVRKSIAAAVDRHIQLLVLTNSADSTDEKIITDASRSTFYALLKRDPTVRLYEHKSRPEIGAKQLHTKAASFGKIGPVVIGSFNMDAWSAERNSEDVVLIDEPSFRHDFDDMIRRDVAPEHADHITLEVAESDSTWTKVRQWAIDNLLRYWL